MSLRQTNLKVTVILLLFGFVSMKSASLQAQEQHFEKFEKMLTGAKLVGSFTELSNNDKELQEEEYTIEKVTKMDKGDLWMFKARIKYGKHDFTVPLPLEVKWVEDTPIITLTDFEIPGFGTFSARVLFYNGKYAGTWSHGDHGGHLFGKIVTAEQQEKESKTDEDSSEGSQENDAKDAPKKKDSDK